MGIITGGLVISGGNPILGAGTHRPLTVDGTPVDAVEGVAAEGTLTIAEPVTSGDTFTIGTTVYKLMTTPAAAYDVAIGGSEAATKVNIVAAINGTGTPGTEYFAGTEAHPDVTAAAFIADECVITAKETGTAGNSIATTETFTDVTNVFDAATLGTTTAGVTDVTGTYEGIIAQGAFVLDNATDKLYENTGTQAVPAYTRIDTV